MSIVSDTLKKLEKKREPVKIPSGNSKNGGKKSKTFKPLLLVILCLSLLLAIIYFLNENTYKIPPEADLRQTVVQSPEEPKEEGPGTREEAVKEAEQVSGSKEDEIKEIEAEKTVDKEEIITPEESEVPPDMKLGGIITGQKDPYAVINGKFISLGEEIDGAKIIRITDNSVTYLFNNKEYTIKIH